MSMGIKKNRYVCHKFSYHFQLHSKNLLVKFKMSRFLSLLLLIVIAVVMIEAGEKKCSPWLGYCRTHEGCCRHFTCSTYQSKCVPVMDLIVPGKDTRPLGDGPFPPKGMFPAFDAVYPNLTQS